MAIDYDAIAKQLGGTTLPPQTVPSGSKPTGPVDYDAIAKQLGGTTTEPVPAKPAIHDQTPEQQAAITADIQKKSEQSKKDNSVGGFLANTSDKLGEIGAKGILGITKSARTVGNIIAAPHEATQEAKTLNTLRDAQYNTEKTLAEHIKALSAAGKDTSHAVTALESIRKNNIADEHGTVAENVPASQLSDKQGLGAVAGVGLDVLSAGTYAPAAKALQYAKVAAEAGEGAKGVYRAATTIGQTGKLTKGAATLAGDAAEAITKPKGLFTKATAGRVAEGLGTGYAYDVSQNAQDDAQGADILKPGLGTLVGGAIPALPAAEVTATEKLAARSEAKASNRIPKIAEFVRDPVTSGNTAKQAAGNFKSGNTETKGILKTRIYPHTANDISRANAVAPYWVDKASPEANIAHIKSGIGQIAEKEQRPLLKSNPGNMHWNEVNDYTTRHAANPDRVISLFDGKPIISNEDVLDARSALDDQIFLQKQGAPYGTPERAKIDQDALRDRAALNALIDDNLTTGGNIEGLNRTQQDLEDFRQRGIKTDGESVTALEQRNGVTRDPKNAKKADQFRANLKTQSQLYKAIDNLATNVAEKPGTNAIDRFSQNNPRITKVIKGAGSAATIAGLADLFRGHKADASSN